MLAAFVVVWMSVPATSPVGPPECTTLQLAVMRGDLQTVQRLSGRRLLGLGAPAVPLEDRGWSHTCHRRTAVMTAAEHGQLASAQVLISSGANINATARIPQFGDVELDARCLAIVYRSEPMIAALDKAGATVRPCEENARLFAALSVSDEVAVERQLRGNPSPATIAAALKWMINRRGGRSVDLLIQAALARKTDFEPVYQDAIFAGDMDLVKRLSSGGARVSGGEALGSAISEHQPEAIPALFSAGARTDNPEARVPILDAVEDRKTTVLHTLLSAGYRGDEETPLLLQAVHHYPSIVQAMVNAGVGVEVDDDSGETPLMAAAAEDLPELVQLLIERGASVRTADINCETAFDAAKAPQKLARLKLKPALDQPPLPGRAARRLGVTCGQAQLSITFDRDFEIYLPSGQVPIQSTTGYRIEPGIQILRVKQKSTGSERKMTVRLTPGLNAFSEKFFEFSRKTELTERQELPLKPGKPERINALSLLEVINHNRFGIRSCNEEQRRRAPRVRGSISMRWQVDLDGTTRDIELVPTQHASTYMAGCVRKLIEQFQFPEHSAKSDPFEFTFNF
jgi:hypothetical protein